MPDRSWTKEVEPYLGSDYELDKLWAEHAELEAKLAALDKKKWLSPEEDMERKRLQKEKLAGKDRMLAIVAERSKAPLG